MSKKTRFEFLTLSEQQAVEEFRDFLLFNYSNRLDLIELFGSKARGDYDAESDIDLLVIVDKEDRDLRHRICDKISDLLLAYGALISPVVFSRSEFQFYKKARLPIVQFIEKEGIPLWKAKEL